MKHREEIAYEKGYRVLDSGNLLSPRGRVMALHKDSSGYPWFRYEKDGESVAVHRLVAYQKFGKDIYTPGLEVRHKDNDPGNTKPSNILLGTKSQNEMDKNPAVRLAAARTAASFLHKLTQQQVDQLRSDRASGATYMELMSKYGIAKGTVSGIVTGKFYK